MPNQINIPAKNNMYVIEKKNADKLAKPLENFSVFQKSQIYPGTDLIWANVEDLMGVIIRRDVQWQG